MRLSLEAMAKMRGENDKVVAMTHYPPFNSKFDPSPFTKLFEEFGVKTVVYGHLHGKNVRAKLTLEKNGVTYYLTSCDMISNTPVEIIID